MTVVKIGNVMGLALTFDDAEIVHYSVRRDSRITNPDAPPGTPIERELVGPYIVTLTFVDGGRPVWAPPEE